MSVLVVDTSIWIDYFRGGTFPALEEALNHGSVVLPPIVAAELLSAPLTPKKRSELSSFLSDLPLHPTPLEHWAAVGALRAKLSAKRVSISTPDAHIAQCAIDEGGHLWSKDAVFDGLPKHCALRLFVAQRACLGAPCAAYDS